MTATFFNKSTALVVLIFLFSLFTVSAIDFLGSSYTSQFFDDDFEYSDSFQSRNYTLVEPFSCLYPEKPFSVGGNLAMGYSNTTSNCGLFIYKQWTKPMLTGWSGSGRLLIRFDLYRGTNFNVSNPGGAGAIIVTFRSGNTNSLQFGLSQNASKIQVTNNMGGSDCIASATTSLTPGAYNEIGMILDGDEGVYSIYINNVDSGCGIQGLGSGGLDGVRFSNRGGTGNIVDYGFDFMQVYGSGSDIANVSVNDNCINNSQCVTGKCTSNQCVYKTFKETCSSNAQCMSQRCSSGFCSKESIGETMSAFKGEYFGDDQLTNFIIALVIIVFTVVPVFSVTKFGGILLLAFEVIGLSIFGLLNPFFIIILMILMAGGSVVIFLMGTRGN